ncbi:hypothetical protein J41TS4_10110 [Paenibacillus apis]|uniref:Uncharacterized protein n=1 Tax=Paenibacillus apis TaxID=1792174 RepID=A0A919Y2S8_9BACL|nr:hypothetical protein J41TS4_10110 [Paenibacillus apis]
MELKQRQRSPLNPDFHLVRFKSFKKSGFNSECKPIPDAGSQGSPCF